MSRAAQAVKQRLEAQRKRALAPDYDLVRRDFELGLAQSLDAEAQALLAPAEPLQKGLGGEIVPQAEDDLPGLESMLQEPDLLSAEASKQRAHLLERSGALELGIEAAEQVKASNAIEKMLAHQTAALHRRVLTLLAESERCKDADVAIKQARAAGRLADAFSRSVLTLQKFQSGGGQTIQVQYMQVTTLVGGATGKVQNPADVVNASKNRGGRPPTTGYRTAKAIEERRADKDLLLSMNRVEDMN